MEENIIGQHPVLNLAGPEYWPHRLLHIPTMTCLERQRDNTYRSTSFKSIPCPAYSTLSYTWMRFKKVDGPDGIAVHGITWKIPSIDPAHFTTTQLSQVIAAVADLSNLEYLWLDVACLDPGSSDYSDPGFSLQKDIFFCASQGFAWLSETEHICLSEVAALFDHTSMCMDILDSITPQDISSTLGRMLGDPWFSSLWTLLEASINPDAILLSATGSAIEITKDSLMKPTGCLEACIRYEDKNGTTFCQLAAKPYGLRQYKNTVSRRFFTLRDLSLLCRVLSDSMISRASSTSGDDFAILANMILMVQKSGVNCFLRFGLLYLYNSVQCRHEWEPGNRMKYTYTQIFGIKPPSLDKGSNLVEIELYYSIQLVRNFPVLSQLFMRRNPAPEGYAWCLEPNCQIPDLDWITIFFAKFTCLYTVSSPPTRPQSIGFSGHATDFRAMANRWMTQTAAGPNMLAGLSSDACSIRNRDGTIIHIPHLYHPPIKLNRQSSGKWEWTVSDEPYTQYLTQILGLLKNLNTQVLLIASGRSTYEMALGIAIGLLLVQEPIEKDVWKRVGLCFWIYKHPNGKWNDPMNFKQLLNDTEQMLQGIFG